VQTYDYADGGGRLFLPLPQRLTFVALQAVDIAGNASALTTVLNAVPLTGTPPALGVSVSAPSGLHDTPITLTATGAASYDFDLDGDGVYDVTGNTTGTATVDTSKPGIIRPGVRGHGADGQAVALGGVSLIITGNTPPAVSAVASPQAGVAPLDVTFTATAQDAEDAPAALTYAWDFDGDGIYENGTNQASLQHTYMTAGTFNASVRVTDTQGAWSAYPVVVVVSAAPQPNQSPTASFSVAANQQILPMRLSYSFDGSASSDPDGDALTAYWDFMGNGSLAPSTLGQPAQHTYTQVGTYNAELRVTDGRGGVDSATVPVYVPSIWSSFGGQPGTYTRQSPVVGAQTNNGKWSYTTGSGVESSPVIGPDGTVYIGSYDQKVYALVDKGTATPTVKWSFSAGDAIVAAPAVGADGTVYVSSEDKKLYALVDNGTATPTVKWSFTAGSPIDGSPAIGPDGTVYVSSYDDKVYALADNGTATPTVKWSFATGGTVYSTPAVGPDGIVYVGSEDKKLYALVDNGTSTPTMKWSFTTGSPIVSSPAIGSDGTVYIGSFDKKLYALVDNGTTTPTVKWSYATGDFVFSSPAVGNDGMVYIASNDALIYALVDNGTATPTVKWSYGTGDIINSSPAVGADGTVYFGGFDEIVYALVDNGTATPTVTWSYPTGRFIESSPAIGADGTVYVGSDNGTLYAFGP
jgi:outer membrane protein assembly factor BamB